MRTLYRFNQFVNVKCFILIIIVCSYSPIMAQNLHHQLKFYLDSNLTIGLTNQELKDRISLYAQDISTIFSKQTIRRFDFNPELDIILTDVAPQTNSYNGGPCDMPMSGYEIWIHAQLTDNPGYGTYGGFGSIDTSGAGVAASLYWDMIHDRTSLIDGSNELGQYWRQIDHIVHEIEHILGAGYSEYYSITFVDDSTGVEPIQNIDLTNYNTNPYWFSHQDYWTDPLLGNIWGTERNGIPTSYNELMNTVNFSDVSVAIFNDTIRGCLDSYLPNLDQTRIHVIYQSNGDPVPNTPVKVWDIKSVPAYDAVLIVDDTTDQFGIVEFSWNGTFSNFDNLMIIKAYPESSDSLVRWFSIFDAQEEKIVHGRNQLDIYLQSTALALDINDRTFIPSDFSLKQNYPNPFNPTTNINYSISSQSHVSIEVFNLVGQKVVTLVNQNKHAGEHHIAWDGNLENGSKAATGIYFYSIKIGNFVETKKMLLLK